MSTKNGISHMMDSPKFTFSYTAKALLRAMAPVDAVIDAFLDEEEYAEFQQNEQIIKQGHLSSDYGMIPSYLGNPWSASSQRQFAALITSVSKPCISECSAPDTLDWSRVNFLPSRRYIYKLISRYVSRVERDSNNTKVACDEDDSHHYSLEDDLFLSLLCYLSNSQMPSRDFPDPNASCVLTFEIPTWDHTTEKSEHDILHIRAYPHHNEVGVSKVWEAGACLSEFLLHYPSWIRGKHVVELGAGVGLVGLIAAAGSSIASRSGMAGAKSVHMTDYTEATLSNLRFNVNRNEEWLKRRGVAQESISVGCLNWGEIFDEEGDDVTEKSIECRSSLDALRDAEVLLGADIVYDINNISDLLSTVNYFLGSKNECNRSNKVAIFASTIRNKPTYDLFEREMMKNGVMYYYVTKGILMALPNIFPCYFNQPRSDVRICIMRLDQNVKCK